MRSPEKALKVVLWVFGGPAVLAVVPALMPHSWLVRGVELAEPGTPVQLLMEYLARALSAFYALLGILLLLFSTDLRRYGPAIRFVALWCFLPGAAFLVYAIPGWPEIGGGWFFWFILSDVAYGIACAAAMILLLGKISRQVTPAR